MMHKKRKELRRRAIGGYGPALCALCGALLALCLALPASAVSDALFVFPYEGFRFESPTDAQVLTQHNLDEHADFLAGLGTDEAAMLASMQSGGVVLEVFPAQGGQIELALAPADGIAVETSALMDEKTRAALLAAYANMPRYKEVALSAENPDWLRMVFSTQQGGLPV